MTAPAIDLEELLSDEIACGYYDCGKPALWKLINHSPICHGVHDNCYCCDQCRIKILTPEEVWSECTHCHQLFDKASEFYIFRRI